MKSTPQADTERVLDKINEIVERAADAKYMFRGESKWYPKVSSTLYRDYEKEIEATYFDIGVVQEDMLQDAKQHTDEKNENNLLSQLQHYGGKTNLIDFSEDFLISLFFACDGHPSEDGRIILQRFELVKEHLIKPNVPQNRVVSQKSIFVQPKEGFIELNDNNVIRIQKELKNPILSYLKNYHDISTVTIYNDLLGFITTRRVHASAYTEFFKGVTCQSRSQHEQAIIHYTDSIKLNPHHAGTYNNRGLARWDLGKYNQSIEDYTKAIELNPKDANYYFNRGNAYGDIGEYDQSIGDYTKTIELNPKEAKYYLNRGNTYRNLGEDTLSIQDYKKVLQLDPADEYGVKLKLLDDMKATLARQQNRLPISSAAPAPAEAQMPRETRPTGHRKD